MTSRTRWHAWRMGLTAGLTVLAAATGVIAGEPDPTAGDPQASVITFPIPAARDGATSRAIVVVPPGYGRADPDGDKAAAYPHAPQRKRYPVVYLLHGYSGNYTDWYRHMAEAGKPLGMLAERYDVILVCAEGKFASWYIDAFPDVKGARDSQWETVITRHLIPAVDRRFRTWAEPAGRGIIGLSMGGHGALYLAARHPELFAACGAMSGVMDLTNTSKKHDLAKVLGDPETHRDRWIEHSVLTQAKRFAGRKTGILIDCGLEDRFFPDHRALHKRLLELGIPHDYIERPGAHTWGYWTNALPYHLQFVTDRLKPAGTLVR